MALILPTRCWGRGPLPALFLHGFTGTGAAWSHLAAPLGDCLTASCPDLPGHGATGPASFDETIDALAALIPQRAAVIGYSMGARLALALALRHPDKVTRLVLESGTAGLTRHHDRALRRAEDEALANELELYGVEAFVSRWERLPMFSAVADDPALAARRRMHSAAGLIGALRTLGLGAQPDFWPQLNRARAPALLLTGAKDAKFTALARGMAAELPLAWHVAIPEVGHAVHLEAPRQWSSEVRAFLTAPCHPRSEARR